MLYSSFNKIYHLLTVVLLILSFSLLTTVNAQTVSSVRSSIESGKVAIVYDIDNLIKGQRFTVNLYSSVDNYARPISEGLSGSVGDDIALESKRNTILFSNPITVLRKYGTMASEIKFKVTADMTYSPVILEDPDEAFKMKRGKSIKVRWKGGLYSDQVTFDLLRLDQVFIEDLHTISNSKSTSSSSSDVEHREFTKVPLPSKLALGDSYSLLMTVSHSGESVQTPYFKVRRKFSIGSRIVLGVFALAVADVLFNNNSIIKGLAGEQDALPGPPPTPENSRIY